jgi:hypothetical protein
LILLWLFSPLFNESPTTGSMANIFISCPNLLIYLAD